MIFAGIIIGALGLFFMWLSKKQQKTSTAMRQTKAVPINQLQANTQAEIQGTVTAIPALKTPFSNRDCVYYEYEVEKEIRRRDAEGRWETDWETVDENKKRVPFVIKDQTGQVAINPESAAIEARDLGERQYRRGERFGSGVLRNLLSNISEANTRVSEQALLANEPAYVFGYVTEGPQGLVMQKGDQDFLISYKSEQEVEKSTARSATVMKVLGIIGIIIGIILIIYSFF